MMAERTYEIDFEDEIDEAEVERKIIAQRNEFPDAIHAKLCACEPAWVQTDLDGERHCWRCGRTLV